MPIPNSKTTAAEPVTPAMHRPASGCTGYARAPLVGAVVVMARVAVAAEAPPTITGLAEPKLPPAY